MFVNITLYKVLDFSGSSLFYILILVHSEVSDVKEALDIVKIMNYSTDHICTLR